jgi:hypothetical protein
MRKLLTNGMVVFAGVALPGAVSVSQTLATTFADYQQDPRVESLRKFFEEAGCPAASLSQVFLHAADRYELDWRLLPSISFVESTGGKWARDNNLFGWNNGRAAFPTMAAGIYTVGYSLANSELYRDKNLDQILATYNPRDEYAQKVKWVMKRISRE